MKKSFSFFFFFTIIAVLLQEKRMPHSSQLFSAGKTETKNTEIYEIRDEMENMNKRHKLEKSFRKKSIS